MFESSNKKYVSCWCHKLWQCVTVCVCDSCCSEQPFAAHWVIASASGANMCASTHNFHSNPHIGTLLNRCLNRYTKICMCNVGPRSLGQLRVCVTFKVVYLLKIVSALRYAKHTSTSPNSTNTKKWLVCLDLIYEPSVKKLTRVPITSGAWGRKFFRMCLHDLLALYHKDTI